MTGTGTGAAGRCWRPGAPSAGVRAFIGLWFGLLAAMLAVPVTDALGNPELSGDWAAELVGVLVIGSAGVGLVVLMRRMAARDRGGLLARVDALLRDGRADGSDVPDGGAG